MKKAKPLSTELECAAILCRSLTDSEVQQLQWRLENTLGMNGKWNESFITALYGTIGRRSLSHNSLN